MGKDDKLQQKSPAEFFKDNKNIAGFDNPGKALYTTIRELVENSLDSAESIGGRLLRRCSRNVAMYQFHKLRSFRSTVLPEIEITVEELSQTRLNDLLGIRNYQRKDAALYHNWDGSDEGKKKGGKAATTAAAAAAGKEVGSPGPPRLSRRRFLKGNRSGAGSQPASAR